MSQTLHQIYQSKAIVLARTMVVKFHSIAEAINKTLIDQGYTVDENDPSTWKYYLNMFGEYHQADKDRLRALSGGETEYIQIKIAGENQPLNVDFTKTLLYGDDADLAVANEYRFNTQYYKALITKYPEFEDLILGVLNPVPPSISIPANDGEILYCGGYLKTMLSSGIYHYVRQDYGPISENFLIESNEENLISILQEYIYGFLSRWWNANYAVTNDLFQATFMGILYLSIPQILGNLRIGNAKTPNAHSFHIREHLESYGNLGWVTEYLSKGVLLWLYRNMVWLNANHGKTKVFEAIIENVLTAENIPISGYHLRHDVSEMDQDNLRPDVYMEREPLNINTGARRTRDEVLEMIEAEVQLATENHYDQEGQARNTIEKSSRSMYDHLNTKVLESTVIDMSNHMAVTREDIGLNLWCYTASHGYYKGTVIFTNPLTNERMQLTPLNAYILAFYCFNVGWANFTFKNIPRMYSRLILRHPTMTPSDKHPVRPTLDQVNRGVIKRFITQDQMKDVLGNYVPDFTHRSSASFAHEVDRAHTEAMRKYNAYARIEDAQGRGYGEWVAHQCYWYDIECPLTKTETAYDDWLTIHGIEFDGFSREDYITLGLEIVEAATGVNLTASDELRNLQTAALAVLKHFASYTVQIIQNTVASDSYWLDWKTTRITNDHAKAKNQIYAKLPMYSVENHWSIKEGPIWLQSHSDATKVNLKETFSSHDRADTTYNLRSFALGSRERAKMPTYGIVDARIPNVVSTARTKKYSTFTTGLYPVAINDGFSVGSTINNSFEIKPRQSGIGDNFNVKSTIKGTFTIVPQMDDAYNDLSVKSSIGNTFTIQTAGTEVGDTVAVKSSIRPTMKFEAPATSVMDGINVASNINEIVIVPPAMPGVDTASVLSGINNTFTITEPVETTSDVMTVNATINETMSVMLTTTAEVPDSSAVTVSAIKLVVTKASPVDGAVDVEVGIVDEMVVASAEVKPNDHTAVEVGAVKLSIRKHLRLSGESSSVDISATKLTIIKPVVVENTVDDNSSVGVTATKLTVTKP